MIPFQKTKMKDEVLPVDDLDNGSEGTLKTVSH